MAQTIHDRLELDLEFIDKDYDLSTDRRRAAAMFAALRAIAIVPQAYHARGPQFVADEMHRVACELLTQIRDLDAELEAMRERVVGSDRLNELADATRGHGEMCPCDGCCELRAL